MSVAEAHHDPADDVAVIGLSGRFPGSPSVDALWCNLLGGVDLVHDYTRDELVDLGVPADLIEAPGFVASGGRLEGVDTFDADLFGFGADEAAETDPQHRLFIEQAWAALEHSGYAPRDVPGTVGVFAGTSVNRYFLYHLFARGDRGVGEHDWQARVAGPWAPDHLPGQVAYRLGLTGPAVATQTACSSGLVAVCQAAQSLLDYRCDTALAGASAVTFPWYRHVPGGLVSPDGRCRAFDSRGEGTGYGSGVAVVVLKRLVDALGAGDTVHAVIRGFAVANDGRRRAGFAAPGPDGQTAVVAEALAAAQLPGSAIGMLEAHGSGTRVGDALELHALRVAMPDVAVGGCALTSVKTSLGHLDAAAGMAGLVKAVLAVREGVVPANLHLNSALPELLSPDSPFVVPVETREWPTQGVRRAGVSSFGLGGTNAHVVVEQPPPRPARRPSTRDRWSLPLSALGEAPLRRVALDLHDHLVTHTELSLDDVEHTLRRGRAALPVGVVVDCADRESALSGLRAVADGTRAPSADPQGASVQDGSVPDETLAGAGRRVPLPTYPFEPTRHWVPLPEPVGNR